MKTKEFAIGLATLVLAPVAVWWMTQGMAQRSDAPYQGLK